MDQRGNVIFGEKPRLRRPYMVCGISGWVDGGEAATGSVRYLIRKLEASIFADMPIAKFHVFQVPGQVSLRPHIAIEDGILKEHRFPQNQFFYWVNPKADHDLILFLGTEPNMNWEEYSGAILDVAQEFAVARIYRACLTIVHTLGNHAYPVPAVHPNSRRRCRNTVCSTSATKGPARLERRCSIFAKIGGCKW